MYQRICKNARTRRLCVSVLRAHTLYIYFVSVFECVYVYALNQED